MGYLIISIAAAISTSVVVYADTQSMLLTFLAYSASGTIVLLSAMIADRIDPANID